MTEISRMINVSSVEIDLTRQQSLQNIVPLPPNEVSGKPSPMTQSFQEEQSPMTAEEEKTLYTALDHINQMIEPLAINLNIKRIESLNRFYVEMVNRETGEVIREIPPKQIIRMQENLRQYQGMVFDKFS